MGSKGPQLLQKINGGRVEKKNKKIVKLKRGKLQNQHVKFVVVEQTRKNERKFKGTGTGK